MNGENPLSDSPGLQPAGSSGAGEGLDAAAAKELAAATHDAATATERLGKAVEKTNRFYRDSPAVKLANQQAEAARKLAREQERAGKGKPAGVSRGPGIDRSNPDLEAAFAARQAFVRPRPMRENHLLEEAFGVPPSLPTAHQQSPPPVGRSGLTPPPPVPPRPDPVKERQAQIARDTGRTPDGRPLNMPPPLYHGQLDAMRRSGSQFAHQPTPPPPIPPLIPEPPGRAAIRERMDMMGERAAALGNRTLAYARMAAAGYESIAEANRTPFMDEVSRRRQAAEGMPLVGEFAGAIGRFMEDMKAGNGDALKGQAEINKARRERDNTMLRSSILSQRIPEEDTEQFTRANAEQRAKMIREYIRVDPQLGRNRVPQIDNMGWKGTGLPDRGTVAGRDEYNLRRALLPPKDRLDAAEREVEVRKSALKEIEDRDMVYRDNIAASEKRAAAAKKAVDDADENKADDPTRTRLATKYAEERAFINDLTERRNSIATQREEARKALAGAEFERSTRLREMGQVRLGDFERREDVARSQAERLGSLGIDGRIQTMLAKRVMDQVGIENLPGEMIQQAAVGFPRTVQQQAERAGQGFVPEFRNFGREEYRDDLPDIRKRVDDKLKQMRQDEADSVSESLDRLVDAIISGNRERAKMFEERVKAAIEKLDAESRLKSLK